MRAAASAEGWNIFDCQKQILLLLLVKESCKKV